MPVCNCQLWRKHTQSALKRFRTADNNPYRILNFAFQPHSPGIVGPQQVNYFVRKFDALIINILYAFIKRCGSSPNFVIISLQLSDTFHKSPFFLPLCNVSV